MSPSGPVRLAIEYVLPIKVSADADLTELTAYLHRLADHVDVTVVDGSDSVSFARHHRVWGRVLRHVRPQPWPGANGKVAGVVTGVRAARHEHVVIADDDVRWEPGSLRRAAELLDQADLVRPQNVFRPMPWHARWDTGRSLLNRCFGSDYPGTYALRRSTFLAMGGYDGNVLFENLELSRTVAAAGGREVVDLSLVVTRRPPTARHFLGQRVRQAYDDFAQPGRLVVESALLPGLLLALSRLRSPRRRSALLALAAAGALVIACAERGRRRAGGAVHFPRTASLWAPLWLLERAVCIWIALISRLRGGIGYAGGRLTCAAHSVAELNARPRPDELPPLTL
jgi:hypothetical protein